MPAKAEWLVAFVLPLQLLILSQIIFHVNSPSLSPLFTLSREIYSTLATYHRANHRESCFIEDAPTPNILGVALLVILFTESCILSPTTALLIP